jgi:hypothetical protein
MTPTILFDPGLQPERTALAWRRTALSIAVGSLVSLRVLMDAFGSAGWWVLALIGLAFTGWMWRVAQKRYRSFVVGLSESASLRRGGAALLAVSTFVTALGLVSIATVVVAGWSVS